MPNEQEFRDTYGSKASMVLPPIARTLREALKASKGDPSTQARVIDNALEHAFAEGTLAGEAKTLISGSDT